MKTRQLITAAAMLAFAGGAMAQQQSTMDAPASPGMVVPATPANGVSHDPYVEKRQADADARAQYKAQKKAIGQQSKADRRAARQELKAQKKEATAERNARLARPQPQSDLNKGS